MTLLDGDTERCPDSVQALPVPADTRIQPFPTNEPGPPVPATPVGELVADAVGPDYRAGHYDRPQVPALRLTPVTVPVPGIPGPVAHTGAPPRAPAPIDPARDTAGPAVTVNCS